MQVQDFMFELLPFLITTAGSAKWPRLYPCGGYLIGSIRQRTGIRISD